MDAHCRAAGHGRVVVGGVDVQLVQGMAALVGDAVQVREDVAGHVMRRDAHVAAPELGGEGVLALGQAAVRRVKPPQLHDLAAQGALGVQRPILIEKIGAHGLAPRLNVGQQRHDRLAQGGKKLVALRDRQTMLVPVKPDLVGVAVGREILRLRAAGGNDLFQIGCEDREVVGALRLDPDGDAPVAELREGSVLVGGNFCDLVVPALQLADFGAFLLGLGLGGGLFQKGGGIVVDKQVEAGTAEHLAGLGAAIGTALGRDGLGVKIDDIQGIMIGVELFFQRTQTGDGVFHTETSIQ